MQMTNPQQQQYDRGATIFSPDGRLFQVEYAKEAVKKGATALGLVYEEGVILAATRSTQHLRVRNPEKVFKVDDHIGIATSGLVADGRSLVDETRQEAQRYLMTYDEPIPMNVLSKFVADRCQHFTQYGGVRPFGVSTIAGGVKDGDAKVYQTDPSGTLNQWKAVAIGKGGSEATEHLEENWESGMDEDAAIKLAVNSLHEGEEDLDPKNIELAIVSMEDDFDVIPPEELEERGLGF
ncbi:archaeal proteasome endopeptidase complex subunit alpha [Candidatus Nanohalococcus occultus]|uniref:Proteasome subunit alpha n=1 Tax=Candidatus Nanohalococcus occultus TaxID=2978047 RepID=A0ABY8CE23_9ARCH|nr:20S proteasome, alpha subunit [Candidatus Nanohaloarchaeota archaeon SVXNc]